MRPFTSLVIVLGAAAAAGPAVAADGNGLVLRQLSAGQGMQQATPPEAWSPLRGRLAIGVALPGRGAASGDAATPEVVGARLLGDYYFGRPRPGDGLARGFRATSGLLFGSRAGTWGPGGASLGVERRDFGLLPATPGVARGGEGGYTVPYLGVGYSDALGRGRWGLSADLGLMALRPADGARLGGTADGAAGFDDTLRQLRLAPLVQLGVSYSF